MTSNPFKIRPDGMKLGLPDKLLLYVLGALLKLGVKEEPGAPRVEIQPQ